MRFREGQPSNDGSGSDFGLSSGSDSGADTRSHAYEALSRRVAKARAEQRLFSPDGSHRLPELEFNHLLQVYDNLSVPELVEHALMRGEGGLSLDGALCVKTVPHTTRSPRNTFIVGLDSVGLDCLELEHLDRDRLDRRAAQSSFAVTPSLDSLSPPDFAADGLSSDGLPADGLSADESGPPLPQPSALSEAAFRHLYQEAQAYVQGRSLYVVDGELVAGVEVRVVTELASQALFIHQLLRPLEAAARSTGAMAFPQSVVETESAPPPPIVLIVLPGLKGEPSLEPELRGDVFTALHPTHHLALLGGSRHFGELVAALMHLAKPLLLAHAILPLDQCRVIRDGAGSACALVMGEETTVCPDHLDVSDVDVSDDFAIKLLSTLDLPSRGFMLQRTVLPWIWSDTQVATIAAADYGAANVLMSSSGLAAEAPLTAANIAANTTGTYKPGFGALLENVILDAQSGAPMFGDRRWSERPQLLMPRMEQSCQAAVQALVLYLPDDLGIFPPVARLTLAQAQYYYLCGYGNWADAAGHGDCLAVQAETEGWGSFRPCFSAELTREAAIARMHCWGKRLTSLPAFPQIFLVNPRHPALESSLEQKQFPWLTSACLAPSEECYPLAKQLFQRFERYMEQFKAEVPDAVRIAGPRL